MIIGRLELYTVLVLFPSTTGTLTGPDKITEVLIIWDLISEL